MKVFHRILSLLVILGFLLPVAAVKPASAQATIPFTILHTNDFHGTLLGPPPTTFSYPGAARVAQKIADIRASVGEANMLLFDAGDIMQGSLLSNVNKGEPVIDYYRTIGYNAATFGNHEFDWGQTVLGERIAQAEAPAVDDEKPMQMVAANITLKSGDTCTWTPFNANVEPYEIFTIGAAGNTVDVGVIGVGSVETPYITIAEATAGMCFRDPAESILHYYDNMVTDGADVIVVLSHNGYSDGGYGYGFTVYGDQTLAQKLIDGGKPADLIIGGHSHTNLATATIVGPTKIVQARSSSRNLGRADFIYDPSTGNVTITWTRFELSTGDPQHAGIQALVDSYATDPDYLTLVNTPVGYSQVDLLRNYNGESMMGAFVNDSIYKAHNSDSDAANDMDMFFNNGGGLRIDWCDKEEPAGSGTYIWSSDAAGCQTQGLWTHDPMLLNYGQMFEILPFGNATAIGTMTGAQIYDLLQQSATLFKGSLQPSGVRWKFFSYGVTAPAPANTRTTWNWGAYNIEVFDRETETWLPLDMNKTYKVGTNEFLAPAGQDGYTPFKYMTNVTYWGDMLNAVNAYVGQIYTQANPYKGPDGDGTLDGRITRNGDDAYTPGTGEVVPVTILHHNDSHGNLVKGAYVGYSQLVTLIKQERLLNPGRTLLVSGGDNIQGDSMMYYFKSAGLGYASDGTPLADPEMHINPLIKAMNLVGYDAMTLGNHEFNFGSEIFGTLGLANFPLLQANVTDDGSYGLDDVGVQPYVTKTVGPEGIRIALLGIGNHRVPSYELPSNIPGLTFTDPIQKGKDLAPLLQARNDAVIALTHIGFTENPASVEVDNNVDTYFGTQVPGVDTIIGAHSHTNPASGFGAYKYNPSFVAGPNNVPVLINHAYRYNNTLGEVILGFLPDTYGGYKVVSKAGRYLSVGMSTVEDPEIVALAAPYVTAITAYNNTGIGQTTAPIDALQAFTQETTGGNIQADAALWKLQDAGITVDFHLSGAMTNKAVATSATPASPVSLKVLDMFTAMPYENSLVVMQMNGPQIKAVLERSFRNYWYYKYDPVNKGGYSYYTTCFLDTNSGNRITYLDDNQTTYENKEHVLSFEFNGQRIDFTDEDTYYNVSSVNYLAAGACNMSDNGHTLWPLDQIVSDTQYYVRDAVIDYITNMGTVSPAIEGRIRFTIDPLLDLWKFWLPLMKRPAGDVLVDPFVR